LTYNIDLSLQNRQFNNAQYYTANSMAARNQNGKSIRAAVEDERRIMEMNLAYDKTFDGLDRKSTRLNSSHVKISYAVRCLKKKTGRNRVPDAQQAVRRREACPSPRRQQRRAPALAPLGAGYARGAQRAGHRQRPPRRAGGH